ncbi:MAG: acyl--CoA ligase [Anaerolineales bacterium]|nr:acyl--CoA ligase [Anaerolineales bacterium]
MTTLADLIHQNYSKNPEKAAIILQHAGQDDKPVSYHDLVTGSARYARTYAEAGLQPGEVIILILQHGEDLVYSFWGAILHGAIPAIMPFLTEKLSPERYRADLAALLSVTQPTAIVTYPEFESDIRSAMTADSSVRTVLLTSQLAPETEPDFSQLRGLHCKPTDIVLLQHSSGTTGLQKASRFRMRLCSINLTPIPAPFNSPATMSSSRGFRCITIWDSSRASSCPSSWASPSFCNRPSIGCARRINYFNRSANTKARFRGCRISPTTSARKRSASATSKAWIFRRGASSPIAPSPSNGKAIRPFFNASKSTACVSPRSIAVTPWQRMFSGSLKPRSGQNQLPMRSTASPTSTSGSQIRPWMESLR